MRRLRIGSALGIPILLDVTFLLVLPVFAFLIGVQVEQVAGLLNAVWGAGIDGGALSVGATPWLLGTVAALGLFAGVILHELGHSVVALRYGYAIESITLWLLGGIASIEDMPEDPRQELLIALAGPAVSVLLGGLCYLAFLVVPPSFPSGRFVLGYLAIMNVTLAAFNLLPGFPMDGGRVLRALLARNRPYAEATRTAASVGKSVALLLGFLGVLWFNLFLIAIAFFIYIGASGEAKQQTLKSVFAGVVVRDLMTPAAALDTVAPETSVADLLDQMFTQRHIGYPVVQNGTPVGMVTLSDVSAVRPVERDAVTVADVMATDLKTVEVDTDVIDALLVFQKNGIGRVLVVDDGVLAGLLTRTDLMRAFSILSRTGPRPVPEVEPIDDPFMQGPAPR